MPLTDQNVLPCVWLEAEELLSWHTTCCLLTVNVSRQKLSLLAGLWTTLDSDISRRREMFENPRSVLELWLRVLIGDWILYLMIQVFFFFKFVRGNACYGIHVEIRGQPWVSFLAFHFVRSRCLCCSTLCQVSWPASFQGFPCLCL